MSSIRYGRRWACVRYRGLDSENQQARQSQLVDTIGKPCHRGCITRATLLEILCLPKIPSRVTTRLKILLHMSSSLEFQTVLDAM